MGKPRDIARQINAEVSILPAPNTAAARSIRRQYSAQLRDEDPAFVMELASELVESYDQRWLAYEFIRFHPATFQQLGINELQIIGQGINSWDSVDAFARTLSGPAWLRGQIADESIHRWAVDDDLWWRRAALVSTVALNMRSHGGHGDVERTLTVCRMLVTDGEDMIVKAMSWALRELIPHDPTAVQAFLAEYDAELAARVKREVNNKLTTGLKNP